MSYQRNVTRLLFVDNVTKQINPSYRFEPRDNAEARATTLLSNGTLPPHPYKMWQKLTHVDLVYRKLNSHGLR